jgi:hypothetical protein
VTFADGSAHAVPPASGGNPVGDLQRGRGDFGLLGVVIAVGRTRAAIMSLLLIHVTCRTHPAHPVQPAEAAPGAGRSLVDGTRSGAGAKHAKSHREQIHYRLSSQYAVNGASTCSWTCLMDAFVDAVRRRSPHPEIDVDTCSITTLFNQMMWVSTDIDDVVAIG